MLSCVMIQKRWKVNLLHFDRHTNNVKKLARGGRANNTTEKKVGRRYSGFRFLEKPPPLLGRKHHPPLLLLLSFHDIVKDVGRKRAPTLTR